MTADLPDIAQGKFPESLAMLVQLSAASVASQQQQQNSRYRYPFMLCVARMHLFIPRILSLCAYVQYAQFNSNIAEHMCGRVESVART